MKYFKKIALFVLMVISLQSYSIGYVGENVNSAHKELSKIPNVILTYNGNTLEVQSGAIQYILEFDKDSVVHLTLLFSNGDYSYLIDAFNTSCDKIDDVTWVCLEEGKMFTVEFKYNSRKSFFYFKIVEKNER